jgi:hypothetical protein
MPEYLPAPAMVAFEDCGIRIAGGQHAEDMLDRKAATPNDRFPSKDARIDRNPFEQRVFVIRGVHCNGS